MQPLESHAAPDQTALDQTVLDQTKTPLVSALQHCADRHNAPFHTPGHKRGQGISKKHRQLFGTAAFRADLPELPDLDNLFAPEGVILQAQQLAAEAFGAEQTWFLANGSTCGIEAAILATCGPGEKIILPRNIHSSAISGMVLSGAIPIYVQPQYSPEWDLCLGILPADIEQALIEHPDAKAVLIVSPTYHGICSDVAAIAHLAHARNIPLIVDEAHAPHFTFHPHFPISAIAAQADIAIQSAHKVLSAFTQAALLHTQGERVNRNRLTQSLQLTQSTSPSYLLLGSLDAARHQMATDGFALMEKTLALADRASEALSKIAGLRVFRPGLSTGTEVGIVGDRTRLTVDTSALHLTGFGADDILHTRFHLTAELPALRHLMFIISLGNTDTDITQLVNSFQQLSQLPSAPHRKRQPFSCPPPSAKLFRPGTSTTLSPRQAFFAAHHPTPITQAIGHICAETICPYPPGIPALFPGEPITQGAIAHLQHIQKAGGIITGCHDASLKTILTITDQPATG